MHDHQTDLLNDVVDQAERAMSGSTSHSPHNPWGMVAVDGRHSPPNLVSVEHTWRPGGDPGSHATYLAAGRASIDREGRSDSMLRWMDL